MNLTRDEILKMEAGPELDKLVETEVMGIILDPKRCPICGWRYGFPGCQPGNCSMRPAPKHRYDEARKYSTDIAAAWEVVNKLHPENSFGNDTFEINRLKYKDGRSGWCVAFAGEGVENYALAPTAPLAICKAALLAKLEEKA